MTNLSPMQILPLSVNARLQFLLGSVEKELIEFQISLKRRQKAAQSIIISRYAAGSYHLLHRANHTSSAASAEALLKRRILLMLSSQPFLGGQIPLMLSHLPFLKASILLMLSALCVLED